MEFRTPYNYDRDAASLESAVDFVVDVLDEKDLDYVKEHNVFRVIRRVKQDSRAVQADAIDADINTIVKRSGS